MKNRFDNYWELKPQELEKIKKAIKKGGNIPGNKGLNLDQIDGRWDLRGINFEFREFKKIEGCHFKDVDFSFCSFDNLWLERNIFDNCVFHKSSLKNVAEIGNKFHDVIFDETDFTKAILGYEGTSYLDCSFISPKMKGTDFIRAEFDNCKFIKCELKRIDFNASSFNECIFQGILNDVWFRGGFPTKFHLEDFGEPRVNKMYNIDFREATLYGLTFSDNCDLSTVKLADNGQVYFIPKWNEILRLLELRAQEWPDQEKSECMKFIEARKAHAKTQDNEIIDRKFVEHWYGKEIGKKIVDTLLDIKRN